MVRYRRGPWLKRLGISVINVVFLPRAPAGLVGRVLAQVACLEPWLPSQDHLPLLFLNSLHPLGMKFLGL